MRIITDNGANYYNVKTVIYTCDREEMYLNKTLRYLADAGEREPVIQYAGENVEAIYAQVENLDWEIKGGISPSIFVKFEFNADADVRKKAQENYIEALTVDKYPVRNGYRLILEDDVMASASLGRILAHYIAQIEEVECGKPFILSLYTPYFKFPLNEVSPIRLLDINQFYGLQACLFSNKLCEKFADYIKEHLCEQPHDFLIKDFCREQGINIYGASHSLFQHIGVKTTGLGHHHTTNNFFDDVNKNQPFCTKTKVPVVVPTNKQVCLEKIKGKPKLVISGEYMVYTGFATVARNIANLFKNKYDIYVVDFTSEHKIILLYEGVYVLGKHDNKDDWGAEMLVTVMEQADAMLIINDVWNVDIILNKLKLSGRRIPKIITYTPVDATNHAAEWYKHFDIVQYPVTYTKYAKGVIGEAAKWFLNKENADELMDKLRIIGHGVDTNVFYPIEDKVEVRRKLFKTDKFDNSFIFLNANRNAPRKRLDITMRAFAQFVNQHKPNDTYLYMHCGIIDQSINIYHLAKTLGIRDRLILSTPIDTPHKRPAASDEEMNLIYNACDVGINTSMGEGWGLCNVEHAMTGGIQIVPKHSACAEIFSAEESRLISIVSEYMFDHIMTIGGLVDSNDLCVEMSELRYYKRVRVALAEKVINKFFNNKIKWSWFGEIADQWGEVFDLAIEKKE